MISTAIHVLKLARKGMVIRGHVKRKHVHLIVAHGTETAGTVMTLFDDGLFAKILILAGLVGLCLVAIFEEVERDME